MSVLNEYHFHDIDDEPKESTPNCTNKIGLVLSHPLEYASDSGNVFTYEI